jgi:hypothetical protein
MLQLKLATRKWIISCCKGLQLADFPLTQVEAEKRPKRRRGGKKKEIRWDLKKGEEKHFWNHEKFPPCYPIVLWNIHNQVLEHLPHTNNQCEGTHIAINKFFGEDFANVFSFITLLKIYQMTNETKIVQAYQLIKACKTGSGS